MRSDVNKCKRGDVSRQRNCVIFGAETFSSRRIMLCGNLLSRVQVESRSCNKIMCGAGWGGAASALLLVAYLSLFKQVQAVAT